MLKQLSAALALVLALATAQAQAQIKDFFGGSKGNKIVMVYVDLTESIKDADVDRIYTPTLRAAVDSLKPGDRMVLAEISEQSLGTFAPVADVAFPITGRSMDDSDALETGQKKLRDQWRKLISRRVKAKATVILDSLTAGGQIVSRDQRAQKWLIVLSDMIEESKTANFAKAPPSGTSGDALLRERRDKGLLPDLKGVQVFVAGASASTSEKYMDIQNFWLRYFKAAGAQIDEKTYGRVAFTSFQ